MLSNQFKKRYFNHINLILFLALLVTVYFAIETLVGYFNTDFIVGVEERGLKLVNYSTQNYNIDERHVYSVLHFKSNKFLDFLFVNKTPDYYLPFVLFVVFVLFQMLKININWYEKKFTKKLYYLIDVLGFVSVIMFIFSRIQYWYLKKLVEEITSGTLFLDNDQHLNSFAIGMMVLSIALRGLVKQGKKLQQEQDLTI